MSIELKCEDVKTWGGLDDEGLHSCLEQFNQKYAQQTLFDSIDVAVRKVLNKLFLDRFKNDCSELHCAMLCFLRLLARDRNHIEDLLTQDICVHLFAAAGLHGSGTRNIDVLLEAEKCLINSLFQCAQARTQFLDLKCDQKLIDRIKLFNDGDMSVEKLKEQSHVNFVSPAVEVIQSIQLFDLRIAFITSAHLLSLQRNWLARGYESIFITVAERLIHSDCKLEAVRSNEGDALKHAEDCANESLKVMFNLYSHATAEMADQVNCKRLISLCADMLLKDKKFGLLDRGALNLLTVVPHSLDFLLDENADEQRNGSRGDILKNSCKKDDEKNCCNKNGSSYKIDECGNKNMFLDMLLSILDEHLSMAVLSQDDEVVITSCLSVLINLCTHSAAARRYVRLKVLPPLHAEDVQQRPEVGEKMRNKLVKVMVGKMHVSQLAAHLFFILCKRSVNRFNKYCGFGNAAGLLANYGLLGAINAPKNANDSEDSETDDYKEVEGRVNPVTGYIEPIREDPLKNMTDEQKEYEAMKLVNAMKNLMDKGVIAPARTDKSGRLRPVEHILELTEDRKNDNGNKSKNSENKDES